MASAEPLNDLQLSVNEINYDNHYPLFKGIIHGVLHLLSAKDMKQLDDFEGLDVVWDNRFRGAIPFLPFLQPFHGVYIMKKK